MYIYIYWFIVCFCSPAHKLHDCKIFVLLTAVSPAGKTLPDIVEAPSICSDWSDDNKLCEPASESRSLFFPFQTFTGCFPEHPRLHTGDLQLIQTRPLHQKCSFFWGRPNHPYMGSPFVQGHISFWRNRTADRNTW